MIREADKEDLDNLLELYLDLHEEKIPESSEKLCQAWDTILNDPNHHIILKQILKRKVR